MTWLLALIMGTASWYPAHGMIAAVPGWHYGDKPYLLNVCAARCVTVTVQDFCACPHGRVIDLSDDAFRRLAPLSQGVVRVTLERVGVPRLLPPTDTAVAPIARINPWRRMAL